jgi:undecaprenyl pyrophosphate synthase
MLTLCSTRGQLYGAGDTGRVTPELRSAIAAAARATAHNTTLRLSVALSYGARQDIVSAARLLATKAGDGRVWARFPGLKFGGLGLVANMTGIANFSQF